MKLKYIFYVYLVILLFNESIFSQESLDNIDIEFIPYTTSEVDRKCSCLKEKHLNKEGVLITIKNTFRLNFLNIDLKELPKKNDHSGGQYSNVLIRFNKKSGESNFICTSLNRGKLAFSSKDDNYEFSKEYVKYLNVIIHEKLVDGNYTCLNEKNCPDFTKSNLKTYYLENIFN